MSRFSGKCDFCDEIEIFGLDHILNCRVYVGDSDIPLRLTCLKDCIPYYPYVITMSGMNMKDKVGEIHLTPKSWVDIEEERYGHLAMHDVFRAALEKEITNHGGER